jgi:anthranilate synthase component 1
VKSQKQNKFSAKLKFKPDLIGLAQSFPKKFPALLNSHSINSTTGRFSILFNKSRKVKLAYDPESAKKLLSQLDKVIDNSNENNLPFYSGWFVYFSYESIKLWEKALSDLKHNSKQPLVIAFRCKSAVITDHLTKDSWVVSSSQKKLKKLRKFVCNNKCTTIGEENHFEIIEDDKEAYKKAVEKAKKYIISGDVYQVNLARKWKIKNQSTVNAASVYKELSEHNPAPFSGLFQSDEFSIISSSPERLVKVEQLQVETRPIAGSRPRSENLIKDKQLIKELLSNQKEQAEHIMLIDLERNDLGRVCKTGTVAVNEFMVIESYAKVHHIVSNVIGELNTDVTYFDVIKSTFPGGTITGCPKIRCMQVIDELETEPRGVYTGSMGYITDDGRMDLNILIRSFSMEHGELSLQAGAGIVYDSIAEKEAQESQYKAQALINSLESRN